MFTIELLQICKFDFAGEISYPSLLTGQYPRIFEFAKIDEYLATAGFNSLNNNVNTMSLAQTYWENTVFQIW